jgi:hypothetical protein
MCYVLCGRSLMVVNMINNLKIDIKFYFYKFIMKLISTRATFAQAIKRKIFFRGNFSIRNFILKI